MSAGALWLLAIVFTIAFSIGRRYGYTAAQADFNRNLSNRVARENAQYERELLSRLRPGAVAGDTAGEIWR